MITIAKWLIPVLLPAAGWSARYTPLEFSHMAVAATLIVHGEIVEVREDTFILDVEEVLAGELPSSAQESGHLEVLQFRNWTCAGRWTPYAEGQEVALFLRLQLDPNQFRILSAGGEGEMRIFRRKDAWGKEETFLRPRGLGSLGMAHLGVPYVPGGKSREGLLEVEALGVVLRGLRTCYELNLTSPTAFASIWSLRENTDEADILRYSKSSLLAAYLVDEMRKHF